MSESIDDRRRETPLRRVGLAVLLVSCLSCSAGDEPAANGPAHATQPADDREFNASEVDLLRSLGYVDVVEEADDDTSARGGVTLRDASRMQPGLTYFTNVNDCSSHLVEEDGTEVRSWRHSPCDVWGNSILLPNGDVLAVHHDPHPEGSQTEEAGARRLLKLNWEGELQWTRKLPTHHDVDVMPSGNIATLTYQHRRIPEIHATDRVRDHYLAELNPEGELLEETSITDLMLASPDVVKILPVKVRDRDGSREIDLVHTNSLEFLREPELAAQNPLYAPSNVLICVRHQNLVMIVDWNTKKVIWAWGQNEISGPHDATLLENGNVLLFDNGLSRKWSRILEVNPRTDEIVWEYKAKNPREFFTVTRGATQRVENGNTLITYSRKGSIFEVTPEGDTVWEYVNERKADGKPRSRIVRARRLTPLRDPRTDEPRFPVSD